MTDMPVQVHTIRGDWTITMNTVSVAATDGAVTAGGTTYSLTGKTESLSITLKNNTIERKPLGNGIVSRVSESTETMISVKEMSCRNTTGFNNLDAILAVGAMVKLTATRKKGGSVTTYTGYGIIENAVIEAGETSTVSADIISMGITDDSGNAIDVVIS